MRRLTVGLLFSLVCAILTSQSIYAQDLKVLVLDALTGKPQANTEVSSLCAGPPSNASGKAVYTDGKGIAIIPYICSDTQMIEIEALPPNKKEQCGDDVKTGLNYVISKGFISNPSAAGGIWCPSKVSSTLKAVPGQITLFVKKPTWWQSHVAG
jgi:hypothetical protein